MINTLNFRTKTILSERKNESVGNAWGVSLDIGYSSVKGFSPNAAYCFPSYAKKINNDVLGLGKASKADILYRDKQTGETWSVGNLAQSMMTSDESNDSTSSLYGRNRYFSPMFSVIARVGLGLGLMKNGYGSPNGKTLMVQTGLPPAYLKSDSKDLKEALSGTHDFDIKIGEKPWQNLKFELPEENIDIMHQPLGTLFSIAMDKNGNQIPDAARYYKSNVLIFDPGFGTLDTFGIQNRMITSHETFDNLGMKQVLKETVDKIYEIHNVEIPIPAMQKYLEAGEIIKFDKKLMKSAKIPFGDILEAANKKVCMEALEKVKTIYNYFLDYDYFVVTGGTGSAWKSIISEHFSEMETLNIVMGNQNDTLPTIFANVRGYYMYQLAKLRRIGMKLKQVQ